MNYDAMTRDELYVHAQRLNVPRRSQMTKNELLAGIKRAEGIDDGRHDATDDNAQPPSANQ